MDEIAFAGARTLVKQIQEKEISSRESCWICFYRGSKSSMEI